MWCLNWHNCQREVQPSYILNKGRLWQSRDEQTVFELGLHWLEFSTSRRSRCTALRKIFQYLDSKVRDSLFSVLNLLHVNFYCAKNGTIGAPANKTLRQVKCLKVAFLFQDAHCATQSAQTQHQRLQKRKKLLVEGTDTEGNVPSTKSCFFSFLHPSLRCWTTWLATTSLPAHLVYSQHQLFFALYFKGVWRAPNFASLH